MSPATSSQNKGNNEKESKEEKKIVRTTNGRDKKGIFLCSS